MATNYPGTINTFTDPSGTSPLASGPDHAQLHTDVNDTVEAIQNVIGTTAGTNILKDFTAGQFPVRQVGGTIQQVIAAGTYTTRVIGSATYQGTVSSTTTVDLGAATRHLINMPNSAGSLTVAVSNVQVNQPFMIEILQGTAGLGTVGWFSTIRWAGSTTPTLTTTASRKDTFGFIPTGTATFDGYIVGQNV
jgi:hypothetical protein